MTGVLSAGVNFIDLIDAGDPVEAARAYDAAGADELCFLDISASHENRDTLIDVVRRTAEQCFMPLTVGGGVRREVDVRIFVGRCRQGSLMAAVKDPKIISQAAEKFGSHASSWRLMPSGRTGKWEIFTHGGRQPTGIDAVVFAEEMAARGPAKYC